MIFKTRAYLSLLKNYLTMIELLQRLWPHFTAGAVLLIALLAAGHVVLYKRDSRSAVAWVGIIWLFPLGGALLYLVFGINRIKRKASSLRSKTTQFYNDSIYKQFCIPGNFEDILSSDVTHLSMLNNIVSNITQHRLLCGNEIVPLINGDKAYPEMINAINSAKNSVSLSTFIFEDDSVGDLFAEALKEVVSRGIEVRVLIDHVGSRYSFPSIARKLKHSGITVGRFMPTSVPWRTKYMNLRTHRKILVIDGRLGFTGGMNILEECMLEKKPSYPVQDLHFRIKGPVVRHLQETFAEDWFFTNSEILKGPKWFPELVREGSVIARGITDGPDEDIEKTLNVILGALSCARKSVRIMTPYFLPQSALISALSIASLRGVSIDILLPEINNLLLVGWATNAQLWQILEKGCRVYLTPPPFDHSKLMLVDDMWSLIGSANWDPRSLRLNFEFNVECYSQELSRELNSLFEKKLKNAKNLSLEDVDGRPLPIKIRDGVARLFTPYL